MNCYYHPDTAAAAFCRACGRPLCAACQRPAEGTVFCPDHAPAGAYAGQPPYGAAPGDAAAASAAAGSVPPPYGAPGAAYAAAGGVPPYGSAAAANPYFQPAVTANPVRNSPALAFILGFIPGVGAIYNGQYLKGLMHALIFGLLITLIDSTAGPGQPLLGILLAAFIFYMPFEAYHTAKKRQAGLEPDEWSSILPRSTFSGRTPVGPIVLIAIGVLYLLNSLDLVEFRHIARFWPVLLILAGAYMLYNRVSAREALPPVPPAGPGFSGPSSASPSGDFASPSGDFMGTRHE